MLAVVHAATFLGSGPIDDDYICYRYAANWVAGDGLVFDRGERFEGFTNPLWVMLLAAGMRVGIGPVALSLALSMLSAGVAAWAVGDAWLRRHPGARWPLPALLVAAAPAVAWHAVAGLGTTLLAALLALWFRAWERARAEGRAAWWAAAWLALACLLRQEAALFALAFGAVEVRGRRLGTAALPLLALAGWTAFRLAYYGRWLPITWWVKKLPPVVDLAYGMRYLLLATIETGTAVVLVLAAFAPRAAPRERRATTYAALAAVLTHALYVVVAGGDFVAYARFFVPAWPLAALLAVEGAGALVRHPARRAALAVAAVGALQWTQVGAIADVGRLPGVGIGRPYRFLDHAWNEERWIAVGRRLRETLPPDASVATSPIGAIGWHSRLPVVDLLGLTNDSCLGVEPMLDTVAMKGHHRIDPAWIVARAPDVVILGNAHRDPRDGRPSVNPWEAPLWFDPGFQRGWEPWELSMPGAAPLDLFVRRGATPPAGATRR